MRTFHASTGLLIALSLICCILVSCRKDDPEIYVVNLSAEMTIGDYAGTKTWYENVVIHYPNDVAFMLNSEYENNGFYAHVQDEGYGANGFAPMIYLYKWVGVCDFGKVENTLDTIFTFTTVSTDSSDPVIKTITDYSLCNDTDTIETTPFLWKKQRFCDPGEVIKRSDDWTSHTVFLYRALPMDMRAGDWTDYTTDTTFHYCYYTDLTCNNVPFGQPLYVPFKTKATTTHMGRLGWIKLTLTDTTELIIHEVVVQEQ